LKFWEFEISGFGFLEDLRFEGFDISKSPNSEISRSPNPEIQKSTNP
jgi:hypothetical protein